MCLCLQWCTSDRCLCYHSQQSPSCPYTYSFSSNFWCFCVFKIHLEDIFWWKGRKRKTGVLCVCGISLVKPALFSAWIKRVKSIEVVKNPLKKRRQENQNNSPDKKCPLEEQAGLQSHSRTPQELFSRPRNPTGVLWEVSCKNRNPPPSHSKGCGVCKTKLSEAHYMQRLPETGKAAGSCSASSGCKWTPHYTELVPVKHWLALSAEYAFHSVPYLNPAYLPISIKKKKHGISFSCKASKSLTRRWSRSKAPVPSHPISLHPSIAVCAWDHSPVPGGREKTEEFTTQEHMGTRNVRSQENQPCDYACNHGTRLILKQDVRKNAKEFVFFPNPVKLPWITSYYISGFCKCWSAYPYQQQQPQHAVAVKS